MNISDLFTLLLAVFVSSALCHPTSYQLAQDDIASVAVEHHVTADNDAEISRPRRDVPESSYARGGECDEADFKLEDTEIAPGDKRSDEDSTSSTSKPEEKICPVKNATAPSTSSPSTTTPSTTTPSTTTPTTTTASTTSAPVTTAPKSPPTEGKPEDAAPAPAKPGFLFNPLQVILGPATESGATTATKGPITSIFGKNPLSGLGGGGLPFQVPKVPDLFSQKPQKPSQSQGLGFPFG